MKNRLDVILVNKGFAPSREKAKAIIMSGNVFVKGQREDKAGAFFEEEGIDLRVKENPVKYVSRGGLKLEKGLSVFEISVKGLVCMDIGASTGGFTDVMLRNEAARVYSIDAGYNQLDYRLRSDERVISMEKTNFRYVTTEDIPEPIDFAACDVSFISLSRILPAAYPLLRENGEMVCLIKPQFEAGREKVGKKGVVRDRSVHKEVIMSIYGICRENAFDIKGLSYSPIKGPEGNIEYLIYIKKSAQGSPMNDEALFGKECLRVTDEAFCELSHK